MRIIEAQSAVLTNYEVTQFLQQRSVRLASERLKPGPKEVETLLQSVSDGLKKDPTPLSQQPTKYSPGAIQKLVKELKEFQLTKAEMIMLINMRPQTESTLHCCIEEIESRLDEEQQQAILNAVNNNLGNFPPKAEADEDEFMEDDPAANTNGAS